MSTTVLNKESLTFDELVITTFVIIHCYKCSIPFAVPNRYKEHLLQTRESFYCPNGHSQAYVQSTEDILKKKIANLETTIYDKNNTVQSLQKLYRNKTIENKRNKTMLKNTKLRVSNGVCPCCNRTFQNLAEHFKTEHPGEILKTAQ